MIETNHLVDADYRRNLPLMNDLLEYYELTKQGQIVYHENRDWKLNGYKLRNGKLTKTSI